MPERVVPTSLDHAPSTPATVWDRDHRALTIGLVLTVAFTAFEALAVATVLPVTVAEIGGLALYGWSFSGFMLANLIGIVAGGDASDARGPAAPFAIGVALFAAGLVIAGLAGTMPIVVAGRVVQGFGAGAVSAVSYATIASAYDDASRPRMIALLSSAWVVPGLLGPALAGAVADHVGWRAVFLGLVPPTLLAAALAIPPLRRLRGAGEPKPGRIADAVVLAVGTAAALSAFALDRVLFAAPLVVLGVAVGVPPLVRLMPPGTLRAAPGAPAAIAIMALLGVSFFGAEAFVPLALTDVRATSAAVSGLPLTFGTLTWTVGAWVAERPWAQRQRRRLIAAGVALIAAGVAGTASILAEVVPVGAAFAGWALAALGMGIAYSTTALTILEHAPSDRTGEWSASLQLAMTLGTALGTGLGGSMLAGVNAAGGTLTTGIATAWLACGAALGLGLAVTTRLPQGAPRGG